METYLVIPCLNEEASLQETCLSLGFPGTGSTEANLVLVDNGSEDATLAVMRGVREACPKGSVTIVEESRRGYVPARQAGPTYLASRSLGASDSALILQADADTIYLPNYVREMQRAAASFGRGWMLEGAAVTCREFRREHLAFDDLCRSVDNQMNRWFVEDGDDVVVDDKVSGFFLADYFAWGGHVEAYSSGSDEMLAETTRLFITAKFLHGASKAKVDAIAVPSRRKLALHAVAYLASAGFPRGIVWNDRWTADRCGDADTFLNNPASSSCVAAAIKSRQRHEIALFGLLPLIVDSRVGCVAELKELYTSVGYTSIESALTHVLSLADEENGLLQRFIDAYALPDF